MKIDLVGKKDADRLLRNMVLGIDGIAQVSKGSVITYWTGDATDEVHQKKIGKAAWTLHENGFVELFQKKVGQRMTELGPIGLFDYVAVVR